MQAMGWQSTHQPESQLQARVYLGEGRFFSATAAGLHWHGLKNWNLSTQRPVLRLILKRQVARNFLHRHTQQAGRPSKRCECHGIWNDSTPAKWVLC